ncbi:hypothetical protein HHL23_04920 [Chryseobacterium sp. RP-3-3]|uniref:Uncharacterized protein n=1 Tax=Chryseobacterium antibioticum TaxID=2728847 RepID=A0A7Y0FQE9_9FLAO|nr:hypothetical protein [Chryseobacterium antibioticum]NML69132.1 hypothetical protein [Chryseobacterium antibioticum]
MKKNKNKAIAFFACLYIFLCPFHLIFAQITIVGNAKMFIGARTSVYINEDHSSDVIVYNPSENFILKEKNKSSKFKKKTNRKNSKIKTANTYKTVPVKYKIQTCPAKSAYFFNNNPDCTVAVAQSNFHSKVLGKYLNVDYFFYFNVSLRSVIEIGDVSYTNKTLKFTYFIRPPPPDNKN